MTPVIADPEGFRRRGDLLFVNQKWGAVNQMASRLGDERILGLSVASSGSLGRTGMTRCVKAGGGTPASLRFIFPPESNSQPSDSGEHSRHGQLLSEFKIPTIRYIRS